MTDASDPVLNQTLHHAILRDAVTRIANGEVLMDGIWITGKDLPRVQRQTRRRATQHLVEMLALQAVITLLGLALLVLPVLLL